MKRRLGVLIVVVALLVGVVVGYGIGFGVWGVQAKEIGQIQTDLQQMTRAALDLKSKLPAPAGPTAQAAGGHNVVAAGSMVKQ
jgi:hypothetical protein